MNLHKIREELDVNDANLAGSRFADVNLQKAAFTTSSRPRHVLEHQPDA